MPPKKNPLRLNKLQLRTLALAQVMAADETLSSRNDDTGEVTLLQLPRPHGNHVHIGRFVVSARDVSGFTNPAVWKALERKELARAEDALTIVITSTGVEYDTGLSDRFLTPSDH
ncbi:MAG TPA: hypothetical protein DCS82_06610 [Rhodospirillaceae bacterium]|nr:hypothetical protein [Rhodospirillaceae bacterium]HAA92566.1 hypothetical protein [Rhodospirillaceae bacterium]HAT35368.1 hypothetical protein [Rhodospirillaceae bacterium]